MMLAVLVYSCDSSL